LHQAIEICYDFGMVDAQDPNRGQVVSVGYPAVEELIETEDFEALNKNFETAYAALEGVTRTKGGLKTKKNAKRAMKSIEIVVELLKELLAIKYRLQTLSKGGDEGETQT
jgi:hypothetical protein